MACTLTTQTHITRPTLVPSPADREPTEVDRVWQEIGGYLHCTLDVQEANVPERKTKGAKDPAATVVAVASNDAPTGPGMPHIVFHGVRLQVLPLRVTKRLPAWAKSPKAELQATEDESQPDPPDLTLLWPDGEMLTMSPPGETLRPGDSIRFQMEVPAADLPYFDYRLTAQLSWAHFASPSPLLQPPEESARPPIVQSLQAFNELRLHTPLLGMLKVFPEFTKDTSVDDLSPIRGAITDQLPRVHALRRRLLALGDEAPHEDFERLVDLASDYLLHIHEACGLLDRGLATAVIDEIRAGIQAFEEVRVTANEVNLLTEEVLARHGVSDDEVAYLYRQ